ncbi:transcription factor WhiB [Rhodococcus ruber Chol-4]|jgi:WhiB family redox-sensing transcriptional regulator|uniref:Transcriptional regulator WhiB n=2 Tax=Rhodococcus TaxID=1827 RepID=M2YWT1_9NOCA|nr:MULTISPECIES: WhiB family transcriptional regulator [Rhodococcus]MDO2380480.1 WhiB family transcriptional regulator [Rhodococcus ruber]NGR06226.1 WhiB family transcriptional regulator [bacterium SGD-2]RIK05718.1 MAG: WhiB family transcriptional regulator [Acidobacteriota bacterium]ATQ28368.1 WhiB family transcriptional regulator [Rhodococcus ruber]AUM17334.1 WhiB family transcriptional regulator [Rhodococcus ruber]
MSIANTVTLPHPRSESWDWQLHAACRGHESSAFFHPDGERGHARELREYRAKLVCARCPVLERCRTHALEVGEPYGVWGGMSESERRSRRAAVNRSTRWGMLGR